MAKIFPKFVDDFHGSYGEEQIFKSLKKWTILGLFFIRLIGKKEI